MDEALKWLLLNAGQVSVTGLLLAFLFCLHRGWVVLGSAHAECVRDRDEFKAQVEMWAKTNDEKIVRLEQKLDEMRSDQRGARR